MNQTLAMRFYCLFGSFLQQITEWCLAHIYWVKTHSASAGMRLNTTRKLKHVQFLYLRNPLLWAVTANKSSMLFTNKLTANWTTLGRILVQFPWTYATSSPHWLRGALVHTCLLESWKSQCTYHWMRIVICKPSRYVFLDHEFYQLLQETTPSVFPIIATERISSHEENLRIK